MSVIRLPEQDSSRILITASLKAVRRCIMCGETKVSDEFYLTSYITTQGKKSQRHEGRCKPCARDRRRAAHAANPKQGAAASRAYRAKHPGYTALKAAQYRQTPEGKAIKAKLQRLRKARMRSGQGDNQAIRAIYEQAIAEETIIVSCPIFCLPELGRKLHVDHIIPLSKGGVHHEDNLQILPIGLNMRKGAKCQK